ncbi:hypothetical protein LCGC14_0676360 [marine sediment metagenome]
MQKPILLFLFLASCSIRAQATIDLSGKVTDQKNETVPLGDVLLFPKENDTIFRYATLINGRFSLENIPKATYRLRISCLGFESVEQVLEVDKSMSLEIKLKEKITDLGEVEVVAAKPILTNTNGNLKIDITNPVFASIPDPMELLAKLPGIQVGPDRESLTVVGKGTPLVYMGNQRISLEELNALSVDDIGSIEIIKNPSSKYEAEGRAVLLITRKISDTEGGKIDLSETLSFKRNFNNYKDLNGSLKKKRLTLKGNFGYNDLGQWESHTFSFAVPERDIFSDYLVLVDKNDRVQINTGAGVYYQINETDYFSMDINGRLQTDRFPIDTDTFLGQGGKEDSIVTRTRNDNSKDFVSANFNYNKRLRPAINIFTGLQFSTFAQKLDTDISNNYNATAFVGSQDRQQKYRIDVLAYRFDLEETFGKGFKYEVGANVSGAWADALTEIRLLETDTNMNIDYGYTEKTYATYLQLSGKMGKKVNFSTGFRLENNTVKGEVQTETIPLVNRENTVFFPKAMLNLEIDSTKSLTLNYSKTIERPDYSRASSISQYINPFLEGSGNVNLLPTFTEELSAGFQYKNSSLSINYSKRKNPMYFTIGYGKNAERAIFSLKNLDRESGFDIDLNVPITKGIWTATNSVILFKRRVEDSTAEMNGSRPYLYFYTEHQFKLGKDTTISFGGWGLTKRSEGIFNRNGLVTFNAAITKTFFGKLQCALRFNDITKAQNFGESYSINGVNAQGIYFADAREIALSLKYSLGKIKEPNYKNKDVDENLGRIR